MPVYLHRPQKKSQVTMLHFRQLNKMVNSSDILAECFSTGNFLLAYTSQGLHALIFLKHFSTVGEGEEITT